MRFDQEWIVKFYAKNRYGGNSRTHGDARLEIEELLTDPKNDWYTLNHKGEKEWDEGLLILFWQVFKDLRDNDYRKVVFPPTISGLITAADLKGNASLDDLDFTETIFLGPVKFSGLKVGKLTFAEVVFHEQVEFNNITILGHISFAKSTFSKGADFHKLKQNPNGIHLDFHEVNFKGEANFSECNLNGNVNFEACIFEGPGRFQKSDFGDTGTNEVNFRRARFFELADFRKARFMKLSFFQAEFGGRTRMGGATFHSAANFRLTYHAGPFEARNCSFAWMANFAGSQFKSGLNLGLSTFGGEVDFSELSVAGEANFLKVQFNSGAQFKEAQFFSGAVFWKANFAGHLNFRKVWANGPMLFEQSIFRNGAHFGQSQFEAPASFDFAQLGDGELIFGEEYEGQPPSRVQLKYLRLGNQAVLRNVDARYFEFYQSEFTEARLINVHWPGRYRLVLADEKALEEKEYLKRTERYQALEYLYRQLKKNFASQQDWELSGRAYISEMEMRKRRLLAERDVLGYSIYVIYDKLAGYTQSFKRPALLWLSLALVLLSLNTVWLGVGAAAVQLSLSQLFLFVRPAMETLAQIPPDKILLMHIVSAGITFVSTLLTTFFVLALRKRFKQ